MPPRKGIVRSGNAGNSSKASKAPEPTQNTEAVTLFPPGSKTPLALLHERCQKNGWEKPSIDTRRRQDGYSFTVTLAKHNKKTSRNDTVRLEPHPPYVKETALEARHWGATYALYRFCNGIQLHRILPQGPREYWAELATEHKSSPPHMQWMWEADPFTAREAVNARQEKTTHKQQSASSANSEPPTVHRNNVLSSEFAHATEVRMASDLRDQTEKAIKKAMELYPETGDDSLFSTMVGPEEGQGALITQLGSLGFNTNQAKDAAAFLSQPSTLSTNLMQGLTPLEASIEYLILHLPECDLPQRFLPSHNSSNPFVSSAHIGTDDIRRRWLEDRAAKEAGWPPKVVKAMTSDPRISASWPLLNEVLNRLLIGLDFEEILDQESSPQTRVLADTRIEEEVEVIQSVYTDAHFSKTSEELVIPLNDCPLYLHVIMSVTHPYPNSGRIPPMFITSLSVPAYVRLHCLSTCLQSLKEEGLVGLGEGICFSAARFIEDAWAAVEAGGPPDISIVMQYLMPLTHTKAPTSADSEAHKADKPTAPKRRHAILSDDRSDAQVKAEFLKITQDKRYSEMCNVRNKLPATKARDEFRSTLDSNRVVIVVGETGCGKTTQFPQYILDDLIMLERGATASIIITQPRRLSAVSVSTRVSSERLDDGSVGYAIRGESLRDRRTKLLFCTTGVVLRRLGNGDPLEDVTHIVIDEVHERSVDGDFLLLQLRELLKTHTTLKVVLMSATINHETFVKYFDNAPLIFIPGFTHPVKDIYLEDIVASIKYRPLAPRQSKRDRNDDALELQIAGQNLSSENTAVLRNICKAEHVDPKLVAAVAVHIISTADIISEPRGAILVFMSGVQEIRQCMEEIRSALGSNVAEILPLHADLSSDEQKRVFRRYDKWKIVVATNVAETSITIDDVVYVVDSGKFKETQFDSDNGLSQLKEKWTSRAAARQRRGRAGRTQPGVCYKLYTRVQESKLTEFPIPEILRVPLESVLLTVKVARQDEDARMFLLRAIDPPDLAAIENAWRVLQELGAIDDQENLTALGQHMSLIPVDLRLAKMMVLGTIFRCLDPILTVAACLSSKPLFLSPLDKRDEANAARRRFVTGSSDLLTDCKAYNECTRLRNEGGSFSSVRAFCEENFISQSTLRDITSLRQDFLSTLSDMGFVPLRAKPADARLNMNSGHENLIKAVILGGLWPLVGRVSLPKSAIKFDKVQAGTVQRDNEAKDFKIFDLNGHRVFLHPSSVLFSNSTWKSPFLVYFRKQMTSKIFLRDATPVPLYALLLFGGPVTVNHVGGGLTVGTPGNAIKLRAWPRIGVLVNQLRRLLDAHLQRSIEGGSIVASGNENTVIHAMLGLLSNDGLGESL